MERYNNVGPDSSLPNIARAEDKNRDLLLAITYEQTHPKIVEFLKAHGAKK